MPNDDLTLVQRCTLITLMAENREVRNTELTAAKLYLKPDKREALKKAGYITIESGPLRMELTDKGWARVGAEFGETAPDRAGAGGAALYRVLAKLKVYLDSINRKPADVFGVMAAEPVEVAVEVAATTDDLEALIRKAYGALAKRPGEDVKLSQLRPRLGAASKAEVDDALTKLNHAPDVSLVPESDQKKLSPADRAAAVSIGNQDKHLISIGS